MSTRVYPATEYATSNAAWLRRLQWALGLLLVAALLGVLLPRHVALERAAERLALRQEARALRDGVWLQAQRMLASRGVAGLAELVNRDPRQWRDSGGSSSAGMSGGFRFESTTGELIYTPRWMEGGERRWQVQLVRTSVNGGIPQPRSVELRFLGPAY